VSIEIAVHAGGYVGLTAAIHYAKAGKLVMIYDPDKSVVDGIKSGKPKASESLGCLGGVFDCERLRATTNFELVKDAPVHVVCVPSEKDGAPWMDLVKQVVRRIAAARGESLIIVESTLTPGTLSEFSELPARGINIAHAPRRDWFADQEKNLATLKRVVGGITPECTKRAIDVISSVTPRELILATDCKTAELVKPLENAFLHVPVMLACEVAQAYPDVDVAQAVELACTHWRLMKIYLNAGTGGRCVRLGSQYLQEGNPRLVSGVLGSAIDGEKCIRESAARAIVKRVKPGARVLVLGIAYRPGFRDAGNSPGLGVAHELQKMGVWPSVCDPMWTSEELEKMCGLPVSVPSVGTFDAVFLATPHEQLKNPRDMGAWRAGQFILDAQGAWVGQREHFAALGIEYKRIGDPGWLG
jgi:UDP-N-acetyl-D-glucosamine dehydrogenase